MMPSRRLFPKCVRKTHRTSKIVPLCSGRARALLAASGRNVNENKRLAGVTVVPQTRRKKQGEPSPASMSEHNLLPRAAAGGKESSYGARRKTLGRRSAGERRGANK